MAESKRILRTGTGPQGTLLDAMTYFADLERAHQYAVLMRWRNGIACPGMGCGSASVQAIATRKNWRGTMSSGDDHPRGEADQTPFHRFLRFGTALFTVKKDELPKRRGSETEAVTEKAKPV